MFVKRGDIFLATYMSLKNKKRIKVIIIACSIVFILLILQLVNVQIVKYDYYSQLAYSQQTRERTVEAKRGTIYDSTGKKVLAQSITTNTIKAVPTGIDNDKKEEISKKLAEILDISEETILNKLKKTTASVELASKVDDEKAKKVYINEINSIPGSLAFYLWEAKDVKFTELLDDLINIGVKDYKKRISKTHSFESNILKGVTSNGLKGMKGVKGKLR